MLIPHLKNLRGIIIIAILMSAFMLWFIHLNSKQKKEYNSVTGRITFLDKQIGNLPVRDLGKYRYISIENYPYPFEIFIGKAVGDFKPKYEKIDNLKPGDKITIYYYETDNTTKEKVNRFVQFIDKGEASFYERGSSLKTVAIFIIGLCVLLIILGIELYKRKKISY